MRTIDRPVLLTFPQAEVRGLFAGRLDVDDNEVTSILPALIKDSFVWRLLEVSGEPEQLVAGAHPTSLGIEMDPELGDVVEG